MSDLDRRALEQAAADLRRIASQLQRLNAPSASVKAAALAAEVELRIRRLSPLR